jgi:hypothetical protein
MRVDVMSRLRGVASFRSLWRRRTTITLPDGFSFDAMSLPDLVQAKKTQRDKDWPMLRRLVEAHYFENRTRATAAQTRFWILELRSPDLLIELARSQPVACRRAARRRPLLKHAIQADQAALRRGLLAEETSEREADRRFWRPLRSELQTIRQNVWKDR